MSCVDAAKRRALKDLGEQLDGVAVLPLKDPTAYKIFSVFQLQSGEVEPKNLNFTYETIVDALDAHEQERFENIVGKCVIVDGAPIREKVKTTKVADIIRNVPFNIRKRGGGGGVLSSLAAHVGAKTKVSIEYEMKILSLLKFEKSVAFSTTICGVDFPMSSLVLC